MGDLLLRPQQAADVAHDLAGACREVLGRSTVADLARLRRERAERVRRDGERRRGRRDHTLDTAAVTPLLDELDEPCRLELAQVVVDRLSGEAEASREPGRRVRLFSEGLEEAQPRAAEERSHALLLFDDRESRCAHARDATR